MDSNNIKATTTSGFDDIKIIEYIEPITAHVVVGMNFFKDIFSGWTDFFGGNSKSYQNTLASINQEVINELKRKAYSLGGNCIIGLKIDNDEVSAQGKSMMMVTALGTVAKADFSPKNIKIRNVKKYERIDNELFKFLEKKKHIIENANNNRLTVNDAIWKFVKKHRVSELAKFFIDSFEAYVNERNFNNAHEQEFVKKYKINIIQYFSVIEIEIAILELYNKLKTDLSREFNNHLIEVIEETKLIDFIKVKELLEFKDFQIKKAGLKISTLDKANYTKNDIPLLYTIINLIKTNFTERGGKSIVKKGVISKKEVEVWFCECGKENKKECEYCDKCQKNIYGFNAYEGSPKASIKLLENKVYILEEILN